MRVLLLALLASGVAHSADLSVFGFQLGAPLNLPECLYRQSASSPLKLYETVPAQTCYHEASPVNGYQDPVRQVIFGKSEAPPFVRNWQMIVLEQNGVLTGVEFYTQGMSAQQVVLDTLKGKYGAPGEVQRSTVQTVAGGTFEGIDAYWHGPIEVAFWGTFRRIDLGRVTIDLPSAAAARRRSEAKEGQSERKL